MRRGRRTGAAAAVVVTAAAVLLLGGCSSGSPAPSAAAPGARTAAGQASAGATGSAAGSTGATGASAGATADSAAGSSDAATEAPGSAADEPKVPDAQLTPPGGGTFTAQQKKYLSGRVPRGTDPVAVLEGGQEICERLTRTSAIDPDAAASAVLGGDISPDGAAAAVAGLCPDQQGVVDAARRGFGDGTFTVGARPVPGTVVAPGTYRAPHTSPSCAWRVTGANGTVLSSGSGARLTVPAAASGVTSSGCYAWLMSGRS